MPENIFDERFAPFYDATAADMFDPAILSPTVEFLAALATTGTALELGVGTGRVALALSDRGVHVHGIEISPAMVAVLQAKAGAETITVTIGDFATTRLDARFGLAYLVYNTISNLITQDEQVDCFQNVARHLEPGGHFVIELGIPEVRLPPGDTHRVFEATSTHVGVDEYDLVAGTLTSHHWYMVDGRSEQFASTHRITWPAELDLMARIAGMSLVERWADWDRTPFTAESRKHISVWQKPA
ncbi:MAG: class I SAM-dependent methyltransferase [Acidimicrobiia bacterium]